MSKLSRVKNKTPSEGDGGQDVSTMARQKREAEKKDVVKKRLKKQKQLDLSPEEMEEMALDLSNTDRMKTRYFGEILQSTQAAVEAVQEEKEDRTELRNHREQNTCTRTLAKEVYRVKTMEVKLALCKLRTKKQQYLAEKINKYIKHFEYGPFHAAIIIGDVVLEWSDSNLVRPRKASETQWIFRNRVHGFEEGSVRGVLGEPVPVRAGREGTQQHFERIINTLDGIRMEKEALVEALVEVAVRYNTKHEYGILSNNCQHFVKDCLYVIGISKDKFPFEGRVRDLADHLIREGTNTVTDDFATHEALDDYIESNLSEMTVEDMEYCICLYHLFHAFEEGGECKTPSCKERDLDGKLEQRRSTITRRP